MDMARFRGYSLLREEATLLFGANQTAYTGQEELTLDLGREWRIQAGKHPEKQWFLSSQAAPVFLYKLFIVSMLFVALTPPSLHQDTPLVRIS
jgi:hypothetical protein